MDSDKGILVKRLSTSNDTINFSEVQRFVKSVTDAKIARYVGIQGCAEEFSQIVVVHSN